MTNLTAEQLQYMQEKNENFLLINTLDEEHFSSTKIPGAVNIPESGDDFIQRVEDQSDGKDQPVVVYCASQQCQSSSQAAQKLESAGFSDVYDFESGAEGWKESGQALVTA